jgi:hypothetical protein
MQNKIDVDFEKLWKYRSLVKPALLDAIKNGSPIHICNYETNDIRGIVKENFKVENISIDSYLLKMFNVVFVTYSILLTDEELNELYDDGYDAGDDDYHKLDNCETEYPNQIRFDAKTRRLIKFHNCDAVTGCFVGNESLLDIPRLALTWY